MDDLKIQAYLLKLRLSRYFGKSKKSKKENTGERTKHDPLRHIRKQLQEELEEMRDILHHYFDTVVPGLTKDLLEYADELDVAYHKIKISKVAGSATSIVGGVLAVIGFGLSFATFGASLGLCIAGGVIGGAGGVTAGGASIAEFVKAREARNKAQEQLETYKKATNEVLTKCGKVAKDLEYFGDIEKAFPSWVSFWGSLVFGSGQSASGFGWKMIANSVMNGVKLGRAADIAGDISTAAVPLARTLGNTAKGLHIAGGVVSILFIPIDVYCLVSNSKEIHTGKAHNDSSRIREIVEEIQKKCLDAHVIDNMIDKSILALYQ